MTDVMMIGAVALVCVLAYWAAGFATMWAVTRSPWLMRVGGNATTAAVLWPLFWIIAALSRSGGDVAAMTEAAGREIARSRGSGN